MTTRRPASRARRTAARPPAVASWAAEVSLLTPLWLQALVQEQLPNGVTVLLQPVAGNAAASVQIWIRAGSQHEHPRAGTGAAHFLEHLVFKGTRRFSARQLASTLEACGGLLNAHTAHDHTVYHADLPAVHLARALDVLAELTLHPLLPRGEFAREREVILREIAMTLDDPDGLLGEAVLATAFRVHPQRFPVIGLRERFLTLTHADLVAFHHAHYVARNLVVVVTGGIDPTAALALIAERFGRAPDRAPPPPPPLDEPTQLAPRTRRLTGNYELGRGALAWPLPGLLVPEAPLYDVLGVLLGGGDSSVLWREVRERAGLVHHISAHSWQPAGPGLFWVGFACEAAAHATAEQAVRAALAAAAARGFSVTDVQRAVRQLVVAEVQGHRTAEARASRLGFAELIARDPHFAQGYFRRLARTTPAELQTLLTHLLRPEAETAVSLLPGPSAPAAASGEIPAPATGPAPAATSTRRRRQAIAAPTPPPAPTVETLASGARLVLVPDASLPELHLRLLFPGGPRHERPDRRGANALLATLLTRDTRTRTAASIAATIESAGGAFGPYVGNNSFGLSLDCLPAHATTALTLLREAVTQPAFRPAALARERAAQLAELQAARDDVVSHACRRARAALFGAHPLAIDAAGDEAGVQAVSVADLRALQRQLVIAPSAVLVAAGDFAPATLAPALRALLAALPKRPALAPAIASAPWAPGSGPIRETQPREQAVLVLAFPSAPLLAEDFYVSEVVDELLGGMASGLFHRVREQRGLAYFVRASRTVGLEAAMFTLFAGCAPTKVAAVRREMVAELARLAQGAIRPAELSRARERLKGGRVLGLQTPAARAQHSGLDVLYGRPADDWTHYGARIDAVTTAQVAAFARRYLTPDRAVEVVVSP